MNFSKSLSKIVIVALILSLGLVSCGKRSGDPKVLIFSKTAGFYHESIPEGIAAIQKLGTENGFLVDTTSNSESFNEENLGNYSTIIFLNTTADVLNHYQEADFERYIQAGGGFVGIHAAADTEYEWGWYGRLVGGYFSDHPGINDPHPNVQAGKVTKTAEKHPSTEFIPDSWERTDEWYSYKNINPETKKILMLDESSYQGGLDMGEHPIAWYHDYDGGRAFYTGGGHTKESYIEELFLNHLLEGIQFAIGDNNNLNYRKAKTQRVPEENRFSKTSLSSGQFTEPTEMTILPNLDVLVAQRRGEILHFDTETQELKEVAKLDVYWKTDVQGVNAEEGLMGIQKDPNFAKNGFVFAFYAPSGNDEINRLSRFTFKNNIWDLSSEKVILEFYSQRNICCHTGGSIAFDKDGLLYLSTGDNSTPFNQNDSKFILNGYAPLDPREGRKQWDARRTSGNSNDLRGKIIRIKVKEDGSYEIPAGNLYPVGMADTKPEIFVQGNRNPYRISVDPKNSFLYWGEVGPDARADSLNQRGPRGYDEVNQARKAGNFGWPYFVGNNYAYTEYDYDNGTSGITFDPAMPINNSPHNTGLKELPAAQPAFIYYPYDASPEFPQLLTGGRNAMAGPVYYPDLYTAKTKFPDYYEGKLFIYDWIRGWIKAVTMKENGDFDKMEPFMPNTKFNALIDMEMGSDGRMYILEYGNGWFSKNADASLSRIDFNGGNRPPVVTKIEVDRTSGKSPLVVKLQATASDPENDIISYLWDLGNGETVQTAESNLTHTFNAIGEYEIKVTATDPAGLSGTSTSVSVYAGNIAPVVTIGIKGNQSFYFPGKKVAYEITVTDQDHPDAANDFGPLYASADYLEGLDRAEANMGHKIMSDAMTGKALVSSLTCKTCHKETEKSIGPTYKDVAQKYRERDRAYLINKIKVGGGGVWGETVMPANPGLKDSELNSLVSYILSLRGDGVKPSLPPTGTVDPTVGKAISANGVLVISATYTDKGGENIKPLVGSSSKMLANSTIDLGRVSDLKGYGKMNYNGANLLTIPKETAHFAIPNIDMTDIASLSLMTASIAPISEEVHFEIRLDSPTGTLIGETTFKQAPQTPTGGPMYSPFTIPVIETNDGKMHKVYLTSKSKSEAELGTFILASVTFNSK